MGRVRNGCNFYSIVIGTLVGDTMTYSRRPNSCRELSEARRVVSLLLQFRIVKEPFWQIERQNFVRGESEIIEMSPEMAEYKAKRAA